MMFSARSILHVTTTLLGVASSTLALGTACNASVTSGTAAAGAPYWLENITHQGISAFNPDPPSYVVFRNVKDYGATGDGTTDDTDAINAAISDGSRCGQGCDSSTTTPALVYFPQGTYVVSAPIIAYYYTAIIGDARVPPTIVAAPSFAGMAVIDADPYLPGGANWYVNQNNFYRSIRNIVIDLTQTPSASSSTGIHWQVSQATSLVNVVVNMSEEEGTSHRGVFMENGSGGFMSDLIFNGGQFGMWTGNQQFTVRNITVNNAATGIWADWNWGWTFQGVTLSNCTVGFGIATGGIRNVSVTVGTEAIIDVTVSNTPTFIQLSNATGAGSGTLVLSNIQMSGVTNAISTQAGDVMLAGSSSSIDAYAIGNVYSGAGTSGTAMSGTISSVNKPASLVTSGGTIFGRGHPMYADYAVDQIVSVRTEGAKGDGTTDDTDALNAVFAKYAGCKIIFVDAGTYLVSSTLAIPVGTQLVGEAWSVIMLSGSNFANASSPYVGVQVGQPGDQGVVEISDVVFTTAGPAPGAIVVEWNVGASAQGSVGMWNSHFRLGAAAGTNMGSATCANTTATTTACTAAYLALHLTPSSSAYLEGTWVWTSDHDLDTSVETTIYTGRGILSESQGPVWMIGVASEHAALYQFNLNGAKDHYMGLIQTETSYYQPNPAPSTPFALNTTLGDPSSFGGNGTGAAWALYIQNSSDILVYGAGFYSFFQDYNQACLLSSESCQSQIVNIDSASSGIGIYSLSTVASTYMISVDGTGVANQADNVDGFASTVIAWTSNS